MYMSVASWLDNPVKGVEASLMLLYSALARDCLLLMLAAADASFLTGLSEFDFFTRLVLGNLWKPSPPSSTLTPLLPSSLAGLPRFFLGEMLESEPSASPLLYWVALAPLTL
jgi:hypothetical protein